MKEVPRIEYIYIYIIITSRKFIHVDKSDNLQNIYCNVDSNIPTRICGNDLRSKKRQNDKIDFNSKFPKVYKMSYN